MNRRRVVAALIVLAGLWLSAAAETAHACPMCKAAVEADDPKPKAYMYSILFMLSVPAMIFGGLGFGLYRMSRQELASLAEVEEFERQYGAE